MSRLTPRILQFFMTLRVQVQSASLSGVAQSRNDHVSRLPETTLEALRMSESTGVELLADQWLNDSGATAHIVSRRHLSSYRVLKEHPSLGCELKAANDGIIATYGIVDIEVRFLIQTSRSQKRVKSFVLTKCIIADIPFSVISPYALKWHGWVTTLGDERESKMSKGGVSIKLEIRDRAWWATAQLQKGTAPTDAAPMDVSTVRAPAAVESGIAVVPTPATSGVPPDGSKAQHVNPKSILKATTSTTVTSQESSLGRSAPSSARSLSVSSDCVSRVPSVCSSRHSEMSGTGLSFFLRALRARLFPAGRVEMSSEGYSLRVADSESCAAFDAEEESHDSVVTGSVLALDLSEPSSSSSGLGAPTVAEDEGDV